jgi:uncharacterized protein with HEPN domain
MRNDSERLQDIIWAIDSIRKYSSIGFDAYAGDELVQVWIVHHIQIIGEAAACLSPALREQYPHVPWPDIVAMRNMLVHQYFGIDLQEVWDTVTCDLPSLRTHVDTILKRLHGCG